MLLELLLFLFEFSKYGNRFICLHSTFQKKSGVLCDKSGTENIPNIDIQNGLRNGNNFGSSILGLSEVNY